MGAIFGFTGPPDQDLADALSQRLSHRTSSKAKQEYGASPDATLGYLPPRGSLPGTLRGIWERETLCAALAGSLFGCSSFDQLMVRLQSRRFAELRGSFVLAWCAGDTVHLLRDGAGRRTLYWGRAGNRWVFAIEPKAIHSLPEFQPRLRPAALAQYLTFSFVPGSGTMLEDLYELPAGHLLTLKPNAAPKLERWFQPERTAADPLSDEAWAERFRLLFGTAIEELRPPGQPAAVFLSGGIDSSIVTAEVSTRHDAPVHTFAVHFGDRYPNELEFAGVVARRCGTEHHEVCITPKDFVRRLPEIVWQLDEPIGDPVSMPNYELARLVASEGFDRVFNGEGGDPCFGGPKNIPMLLSHWYGGADFSPGFRERAYLASYRRAYEELETLLTPGIRAQIEPERDLEQLLTPFFGTEQPERFLDKLLLINMRLKGAHLILPKVERMLGAHGMVPLSPLFDERLIEVALQLPSHLKLHGGVDKVILKRAFRGRLPDVILDRPKSGMRVPVHYWFKSEMRGFARSLLSRKAIRDAGIFREDRVRQLLRYDPEDGAKRFGLRLWMLMTFEIWRRLVVERQRPEDIFQF